MNRRDLLKMSSAAAAAGLVPAGLAFAGERRPPAKAKPPKAQPPKADTAPKKPRLVVRRSSERGRADYGWLKARFTFSFGRYWDRRHTGFRGLRVMNEDRIAPGGGFPMHPHDNMEILTYVLDGALEHRDSLGNGGIIRPGMVQRMSAGRGIRHSEFEPSKRKGVHLMQIWILPSKRGTRPSYAEKVIPVAKRADVLCPIANPRGTDGAISIGSDVHLYASILGGGKKLRHVNRRGRHVWIQVPRGEIAVNGQVLRAGDGVRTSDVGALDIVGRKPAELLLFDLA